MAVCVTLFVCPSVSVCLCVSVCVWVYKPKVRMYIQLICLPFSILYICVPMFWCVRGMVYHCLTVCVPVVPGVMLYTFNEMIICVISEFLTSQLQLNENFDPSS